jgi:hypothetical protein
MPLKASEDPPRSRKEITSTTANPKAAKDGVNPLTLFPTKASSSNIMLAQPTRIIKGRMEIRSEVVISFSSRVLNSNVLLNIPFWD